MLNRFVGLALAAIATTSRLPPSYSVGGTGSEVVLSGQASDKGAHDLFTSIRCSIGLHTRLGAAISQDQQFAAKSQRMRWATYQRLLDQYDEPGDHMEYTERRRQARGNR